MQAKTGAQGGGDAHEDQAVVPRRPSRFTKRDLVRAVDAVQTAGLKVASVRIDPDGSILLIPSAPEQAAA
jgi:hypothetical protein